MSRVCELTNKKTIFGGSRKHKRGSSGGGGVWQFKAQRTPRTWKLNLRKTKLVNAITGKPETLKISMKSYKRLKKGVVYKGYKLA